MNLDISEIFKPIIVDRVIFTIINKRMLNAEKHFFKDDNNGIFLNKEGKNIFLKKLNHKLNQKITINSMSLSYETLIRLEIKKLLKSINFSCKYEPYKYQ